MTPAGGESRAEGHKAPPMMYTVLYMASTRTQIYLTVEQRRRLDRRGRETGAPLARMIREAVDVYLGQDAPDIDKVLDEGFGALPDIEAPRREEWRRREERIGQSPAR